MPSFSQASYPENFFVETSDMLLTAPRPQFLYAQLFLGALGASLPVPGAFGLSGRELPNAGVTADVNAGMLTLSNPMYSEVIAAKVDFSGSAGSALRINRPIFSNTTATEAARKIATGQTISTTPITIQSDQTNLTLFKYGGPYDATNSRVAPYAIEAFDANIGVHNAVSLVGGHMKYDFQRFIDSVNVSLLDLAATVVYPDGMTANNDATAVGSFPMSLEQISRTEQLMDDANLPTFSDGFRVLVLKPRQLKQLKDDPNYQRASENHPAYNVLFPQYVASVGKFHIFRSTTLTTSANSSSVNIDYGHAIAPGALLAGMGRAPRVATSTDDNYGEQAKMIWLADLAFGLADNTFVYSVRSAE